MAATGLRDIRTWPSPRPDDDGISLLIETIREFLPEQGGRIGLQTGAETHVRMPINDLDRLRTALGGARWVDSTMAVRALRQLKTPSEIEKIRLACGIAGRGFERLYAELRGGMSEVEVFRRFKIACLEEGADDVDYVVGGAGPGGYGDIISPPSERPLTAGDVLMLDVGLSFDGYFCDFDRNFSIGPPSPETSAAYDRLWRATEAGLAAARPGATCGEIYDQMAAVLEEGQADRGEGGSVGRFGHGLGTQLTEFPSIAAWDDTVLEAGMVITLEPSLTIAPGRMMVHEENVAITREGVDLLTTRAAPSIPVVAL